MLDLPTLNAMPGEDFARALDGVFEGAPWLVRAVSAERPFSDPTTLHARLMAVLRTAPGEQLAAFLNEHPELTARDLAPGPTHASSEGGSADPLLPVIGEEALAAMLRDHRVRHGIPFIIAPRRRTPEDVLRALSRRLGHDPAAEREAALEEVGHIARLRLLDRLSKPPRPAGALVLLPKLDQRLPKGMRRVVLMQESRPVWTGQPRAGEPVTLLGGAALRVGHYALTVQGWAEDALPRGAALFFAVRDPEERTVLTMRATPSGVGLRVGTRRAAHAAERLGHRASPGRG